MRYFPFIAICLLTVVFSVLGVGINVQFLWLLVFFMPLTVLGIWDMTQHEHSLRRLYPVSAHFRWFFEWLRPYLREYLLDSDYQGRPFTHDQRELVYRRAKNIEAVQGFGTKSDLYAPQHEWINHAIQAKPRTDADFRVLIGSEQCKQPYRASVLNISAMSFGSLSGNAIEALNLGAKLGGFYHDTGEGGVSKYHTNHGGDLVWEIGTGYFGCRDKDGSFDASQFADRAASDQIKMIEIKLSQGAKPGHGGLLPGPKVTDEIAVARGVEAWHDVLSPPYHRAFSSPISMMEWIAKLREGSGGKPVGFKLCVGHRWEFLAIVKAIIQTEILPDYIVIDGAEGGTGATPVELADHVGTPLREGLVFVVNALTGTRLREKVRVAASGKIVNGHMMAANIALGADWCNSARGFMFALGCVQTRRCHTGRCPTGVATQDAWRQAGLVVADKAPRVHNFQKNTVAALADYVAAAGLEAPFQLQPHHLRVRMNENLVRSADLIYDFLSPGVLLHEPDSTLYNRWWAMADANSFVPKQIS